ncbi:transposase domain-containing protein [Piscinibacter sakaiensis]|uniref:transposase domain-containing protein n=1 Tax=Piscinibacter sakaiensis TaxID=1547922 RepID=UPI003AAF687F
MITDTAIDTLDPQQLRQALRGLRAEVQLKDELIARRDRDAAFKQALIDKLTHENAVLKRLKFAAKSEAFTAEQKCLIDETLDTDLAALAAEIEAIEPGKKTAEDRQTGVPPISRTLSTPRRRSPRCPNPSRHTQRRSVNR